MSYLKHTVLVVIGLLLMVSAAWAQVDRGTMTGIITDQSGGVIPGVSVSVTNQATDVATNVTTSSAGVYTAPLLRAGIYRVAAEKEGFKKFVQTGIVVGVGETVRADVSMTLGARTETVQVTGQAPLLQRETAELGNVITGQEVEELPLTSVGDQRTPASFMKLAPGVTGRGNSSGGPGANQYMTTSVGGSIVSSTTLKLDGADFTTPGGFEGNLSALQIPPDAIGEFNLQATNPSAEYGRSVGGTASFVMKSGANQIHGTAYEFDRNTALNANPWFVNASNPGCEANGVTTAPTGEGVAACKAPYKQNEFGAAAGGPIKKDKLFVFGYYDGFRLIQGNATGEYYIPTAAQLEGNYNADPGQPTLYDPISQTTCGNLVCNNIVNPTAIDPVSAKVIPLFPKPTSSGVVNGVFTGLNYISTTANPLSVNMWGLKGDYNVNEKNRLAVTFATGKNTSPNIPAIPAPLQGGDQPSVNQTRNYRVNWNLAAKSNLVNQVTLNFDEWNSGVEPVSTYGGKSDWISYLGLKGLAPLYGTEFPQINLGSYAFDGGGGAGFTNAHGEGVQDSLTWVKSRHTVKMGFQYLRQAANTVSAGRTNGYFQFLSSETGLLGDQSTGIATASFLLGRVNEEQVQYIYAPFYPRSGYYGAFAQDDFKVTKKLTLNLGVRWDYFQPDFQRYNHKAWVDPTMPNPDLTPNIPGTFVVASPSNPYGVNTYKHLFSPRLGLAYALNDKTVIRAGYGIMYGQGNATALEQGGQFVQGYSGSYDATSSNGLTPGVIWSVDSAVPFTPSFGPATYLGGGTPRHSAGSLFDLEKSDGQAPYAQNFNFTVERQLPGQATLSVGWVGNTGIHLPSRGLTPMDKMPPQYLTYGLQMASDGVTPLLNALIQDPAVQASAPVLAMPIDPATGNHSPFNGFEALYSAKNGLAGIGTMGQALRTNPQYQGLHRDYEGLGVSTYNALQVKLDKRFSNGLTLLVSYAWAKTLTDGGSMFSTFSSEFGSTTPWNRKDQKGPSFMDIPNNLSISYIYDLPFGQGKKFANHGGVVNAVVGGWKWSGILSYQGGQPQNIQTGPSAIPGGLDDQGWGNANRVAGVPVRDPSSYGHFDPHKDELINEKAFVVPPAWTFGSFAATSETIRSFPYSNEDMSLMKEWNFTLIHDEPMTLRFNADFFNLFNRTIFGASGENGAYAQEPVVNYPGYGALGGQTNTPRQVQFALRLKW
jgi:hypothetical protein